MICAGTGIAPFRGFIMERAAATQSIGKMKLFFGSRNESEFLYKDELTCLKEKMNGTLDIVTAYSRSGEKVYVQQRVREQAAEVAKMIMDGANVYICGSAAMARDVEVALVECLVPEKGNDAEIFVKETLKKTRRLQEDVW
jgi:NADPH-ferrihemoprotein reductase